MATLSGYCPDCGEPISAFVSSDDLRREDENGFAAWLNIPDVTCPCGGVLGDDEGGDDE